MRIRSASSGSVRAASGSVRRSRSSAGSSLAPLDISASGRCWSTKAMTRADDVVGDSEQVAILAPIGRDGAACRDLLTRTGVEAVVCEDLQRLLAALSAGVGAALVAEEALFAKPLGAVA